MLRSRQFQQHSLALQTEVGVKIRAIAREPLIVAPTKLLGVIQLAAEVASAVGL